ncbi:hypothetical protein JCM5353_004905 [Sporobolomyces roseus]
MLNSARTQILKQCTCSLRTSAPRTLQTIPRSTVRNLSTSCTRLSSDLPWFVDPPPSTSTSTTHSSSATLATAPVPTLPPSHLSPPLFPLHDHLSVSPFFDKDTLTYIHAREADPMGSWCDWVVICTLKEGRERGLRGAVEGVRSYLASNPVELDLLNDETSSSPSPFSPPMTHPSIHGLPPTTASKHARSRANKGPPPTRQDQASGWALLDAGTLVVHVMTKEARVEYGDEIERVWKGIATEEGVVTKRDELEKRERDRELEENMREVEEEMRREEKEKEMPFTVPSPLAPLYAYFPLLTVSNDDSTTPAPSKPTLWVLGPPPTGHKESLDPVCRQAQSFARFSQLDAQPRYLTHGQGAPGGSLPALHLPQGDLIETEGVNGWISTGNFDGKVDEKQQDQEKRDNDDVTPQDPILQAYTSLVETTLLPAVVAALYLLPAAPQVTPSPNLPFLSQLASKWLGISKRQDRISQVKRLRGGKVGSKVVLDLEEVEREAVEALQALEDKMQESRGDGEWFLGASSPSQLDALLYSLLSIISVLPSKGDSGLLRTTLERCPALSKWYKSHDP